MSRTTIAALPRVADRREALVSWLTGRQPAVFLDYDGTLTPIVDDPAEATLPPRVRDAVGRLARVCPVAVVSGRDLEDVRSLVGLDGIHYAGSHGFDIITAGGERIRKGEDYLGALDAAEADLRERFDGWAGLVVERKRYAIAVHYRGVADVDAPDVEEAVRRVGAGHERLRVTGGKRIYELRPDVDWDKGRALELLREVLGLDRDDVVPVYVGDDLTDEDAFEAVADEGLALVVAGQDDDRSTAAHYAFADPEEVAGFLEGLAAQLEVRLEGWD